MFSLSHIYGETGSVFRENGAVILKQRDAYCAGNYKKAYVDLAMRYCI